MARYKNYLFKDKLNPPLKGRESTRKRKGNRQKKERWAFKAATHDQHRWLPLKPRERKRQHYHTPKKAFRRLLHGWDLENKSVETSHHCVYELEKSRVVVCKAMSFKEEALLAKAPGIKDRKEQAAVNMSVKDWYLPISFIKGSERAVLLLDRDHVHFATIHWRPPAETDSFNQALRIWADEIKRITTVKPLHQYSVAGTLSRSNKNYRTSHLQLRGKGTGCSAYSPNWDKAFFLHRKLLGPLVFEGAADVIRHRISTSLKTAHLSQFRKMEQWHRDGYVREHPFPSDWTNDDNTKKRIQDAGSGIFPPYTGFALKWPTLTAACKPHLDSGEEVYSPCTLMPYGEFEGGALVLDQAGVILDLRHGDLCTFPATAIFHYNTPITSGERGSMVNHMQALLSRTRKGILGEDMFKLSDYAVLNPRRT